MILKIGFTLFMIGIPAMYLMRWFGSKSLKKHNAFDYIGGAGALLCALGAVFLLIESIITVWGIQ